VSIFDRSETKPTQRYVPTIGRPSVTFDCKETGGVKLDTFDSNEEWELRLVLAQRFWANRAQRPHVEQRARKALAAKLYEDVLRELPHLRLCIESGDTEGAREACARIQEACTP